jgi:hypothetical protein
MPTTPTGNFALVIKNLETLICSSTTFQTGVGVATVDAARDKVYWLGDDNAVPDEGASTFAWIRLREGWTAQMDASGGGAHWHQMPLEVMFERPDADADATDAKERQIKFWNWIGAVIAEMEALAKTGGYLWVTRLNLSRHTVGEPQPGKPSYQQAVFEVQVF